MSRLTTHGEIESFSEKLLMSNISVPSNLKMSVQLTKDEIDRMSNSFASFGKIKSINTQSCIFEIEEIKSERPPVGVYPRFLHTEDRLKELELAIQRRVGTSHNIPNEWIEERNELLEKINKK